MCIRDSLGVALTFFQKDVLVVDANLTTSHLGFYFGMYFFPITLPSVLSGKARVDEAIYRHFSGVRILPSSIDLKNALDAKIRKIRPTFQKIKRYSEITLVDCAPGFGKESTSVLKASDEILIVSTPDITSLIDTKKLIELSRELNKKIVGIVLNRVRFSPFEITKKEFEKECGEKVLVEIPESSLFKKSLFVRQPAIVIEKDGLIAEKFKVLAAKILNESYIPKRFDNVGEKVKLYLKTLGRDFIILLRKNLI